MKSSASIIKGILIFAVIVVIGVGLGWLASRRPATAPPKAGSPDANHVAATPKTTTATTEAVPSTGGTNLVYIPIEGADSETSEPSTNWEDMVGEILGDDTEITNKVVEMVKLYPKLSDAGKLEVVEHLANLVPDEDYTPLANILTNANTPARVSTFLLSDVINRPKEVMLPLTLAVARNPNHPGAKEAKDNLELFIDPPEDLGDDWDKWEKAMNQWIKDNPD